MHNAISPDNSDSSIEREIQAKGKTAPRVTPSDVAANIASEHYFTAYQGAMAELQSDGVAATEFEKARDEPLKLLTFCVLVLRNGFTVTGESACASPENYDKEIGQRIARQNAEQKIWSLMGYALKQDLWRASLPLMTEAPLGAGQFRKKPVVIEAFQMTKERRADNRDWPEWLNRAWSLDHSLTGAVYPSQFPDSDGTDELMVRTLEGPLTIAFDDYIIKGVKGELYPCKPDIFAATYEAAS